MREFLMSLANDPHKLDAYKKDPKGVLAKSSLSAASQKAILDGDAKAIRAELQGREAAADTTIVIVVA